MTLRPTAAGALRAVLARQQLLHPRHDGLEHGVLPQLACEAEVDQ
jgi:hypothetical protein